MIDLPNFNVTAVLQTASAGLILWALKVVKDVLEKVTSLSTWAIDHEKKDDERFTLLVGRKAVKRKRTRSER